MRGSLAERFNIDSIEPTIESTYRKALMFIICLALVSFVSLATIVSPLVRRPSLRLKVAEEKLCHLAITDELTGLCESIHSCQVSMSRGTVLTVTASFGVAWDENADEAEKKRLKQVDEALYRAKKLGRNRAGIYS